MIADDLEFVPERMNTDYNGVLVVYNNILCYGDYGIITRSTDLGDTWSDIHIGDKHNILEMLENDNKLYAVTPFSIIVSTDEGLTWSYELNSDTAYFNDIVMYNNELYILTNNKIEKYDKDMNFLSVTTELDTNLKFQIMETDGINLYISANNYLLTYNFETGYLKKYNLREYDIISSLDYNKDSCIKIQKFIIDGGILYAKFEYETKDNYKNHIVAKSEDGGKSWRIFTKWAGGGFNVFNNELFKISPVCPVGFSFHTEHAAYLFKFDNEGQHELISDTSYSPEYKIRGLPSYKDLERVNESVLIATGKNKLIAMSSDNGRSWYYKSYFNYYFVAGYKGSGLLPIFANENFICAPKIYGEDFYKTLNSGATWLPKKYDTSSTLGYDPGTFHNYHFDSSGNGFVFLSDGITQKYSTNYGESYEYFTDTALKPTSEYDTGPSKLNLKYVSYFYKDSNSCYSKIYKLDEYGRVTDVAVIDSLKVFDFIKTENDEIYGFGLSLKYYIDASTEDSLKVFRHVIIKLDSNNFKWDTIAIEKPIFIKAKTSNPWITSFINSIHYFKNKIYIYSLEVPNRNTIFTFDTRTNTFDSLNLPFKIAHSKSPFFNYSDELFFLSDSGRIYYKDNIEDKESDWRFISLAELFPNWDPYDIRMPEENKHSIVFAGTDDSNAYIGLGKSYKETQPTRWMFKVNIVKLKEKTPTSVKDTEEVESNDVYLLSHPTYPSPATELIKCKVLWNRRYNIEDASITIYNILGQKVTNPSISINRLNPYSAIISWYCGEQKTGVYLINIKLSDDVVSEPAIIVK